MQWTVHINTFDGNVRLLKTLMYMYNYFSLLFFSLVQWIYFIIYNLLYYIIMPPSYSLFVERFKTFPRIKNANREDTIKLVISLLWIHSPWKYPLPTFLAPQRASYIIISSRYFSEAHICPVTCRTCLVSFRT